MRSRKILWGLACLVASTALFADKAHADRRTGLGGNLLIQDPDDLFPFPQYALKHRNMIRLDYGAPVGGDTNRGNGVLTLGNDKNAFGLAMHRGDLLSPDVVGFNTELAWLGGVGNPFGATSQSSFPAPDLTLPGNETAATTTTLPATVLDAIFAHALGKHNAFGVRFGYGRGIQSVKTADQESKGASTFFVGQFGFSMAPPEGLRLDVSGNLLAAFGKSGVDGDINNKGFDLRFGALTRGYYAVNTLVDMAFLGGISADNERTKDVDTKSNDFSATAMAGVGPAIHTDRAQIAAYGGFQLGVGKNVPDTDDDDQDVSRLNFLAPMVNMAVEVQLLDWLYVRTAAQYTWQVNRYKGTDADVGGDRKERHSSAPFTWSLGLGVKKNEFYFDGVVQNALVTSGPNFIGGNAAGFLAMASATYKFGDVFAGAKLGGTQNSNAAPGQEPAAPAVVAPAPEPEPAPEPVAPAPEAAAPSAGADASANAASTTNSAGAQGTASGSLSVGR